MAESSLSRRERVPSWAKKILPVFISFLILYYYFHDQDWQSIINACTRADMTIALAAVFIPQFVFWFFEVLVMDRLMTWFHKPFPAKEYFWARGAIYILQFVTAALGSGGILLYIQRKTGVSWQRLMGIMLFRVGLMLWGICIFMIIATLAMHYYGLAEKANLNMYVWWAILIFPGLLWMIQSWMTWHHNRMFGLSKLVVRNRESDFWTAFRMASKKQWFLTWAMTLPPFFLVIVGFYFLTLAFDVKVPLIEFMVLSPLALLIMDLPVAFAGFGTATVAWLIFFGDYGSEDNIKALTLFLPFTRAAFRGLIAIVSLKPAIRDIYDMMGAATAENSRQNTA